MNSPQVGKELRELLTGEQAREALLVFEHLFAQAFHRFLAAGREKDAVPTAILHRASPREPLLDLQAMQEPHDRRLVDIERLRELELRNAGVRLDKAHQGKDSGTDAAATEGAVEVPPERDLCPPDVVADEIGEKTHVDGPGMRPGTLDPNSRGLLFFGHVRSINTLGPRHYAESVARHQLARPFPCARCFQGLGG